MRMLKAYWMQNCCFMNPLDKKDRKHKYVR